MMTHGSLFSGIGGFDLAAQWCGWTNVFQCETNEFCRKVLKYHFPNTELYADIKTADFTKHKGAIDVISGGFPCQPFSVAGKRKGTEDDRFLWQEMFRVIQDVQPTWVVAENVYGLVTQQRGVVFKRVCADLENKGYEVQPFIVPACAVNARHRRDRVWIIAHSDGERQKRKEYVRQTERFKQSIQYFQNFPTQPPVCSGDDGFPDILDGITFPAWKMKSIEACGNAVVPQVAYEIFKIINIINNQ